MATWSRRERVTRTVEWAAGRLGEFEEPSDDLIRVLAGDDEVIVFYESEEK